LLRRPRSSPLCRLLFRGTQGSPLGCGEFRTPHDFAAHCLRGRSGVGTDRYAGRE
jgi:hypothetical protein